MKVVFFGLGSVGQRHLRLLQAEPFKNLGLSFFRYRGLHRSTPQTFSSSHEVNPEEINNWESLDRIKPDIAFICSPTAFHIETALECAKRGMHLFIEKPIGHSMNRLSELLDTLNKKNCTSYLAYPFRFHPGVQALKSALLTVKRGHVRAVVSSYLPAWRPSVDYKNNYSSHHDLGGGVILDLSHEFDLLRFVFGQISDLSGAASRIFDYTVDSEDFANAIFRAGPFFVNLHLNFGSIHPQRTIEVDLENSYLKLDLITNQLITKTLTGQKIETLGISRDGLFIEQLKYFFTNLSNPRLMNNLHEASELFEQILNYKSRATT